MQRPDLKNIYIFFKKPFLTLLLSSLFQVLVPLVLLQALQYEGQSLETLLHLGVRFLEEDEAGYIIQQGGWVSFKACHEGKNYYTSTDIPESHI